MCGKTNHSTLEASGNGRYEKGSEAGNPGQQAGTAGIRIWISYESILDFDKTLSA